MGHHHDGQDDSGNDITDDHLDKSEVGAVSGRGYANDSERAGFGGDDGEPDAPPLDVFAAEKVVASVALVASQPDAQADDCEEIADYDGPVCKRKVIHRQNVAV